MSEETASGQDVRNPSPPGAILAPGFNERLILDIMRRSGSISRVELSNRTGLSRSTVTEITGQLLRNGQIRFDEAPEPNEKSSRGRPRVLLSINPHATYAIGVRVAVTQITVSITDFVCEVVGKTTVPFRTSRQPPSVVADIVEDAVHSAIASCGLKLEQMGGLCAGVPGIVDSATGVCHWSPAFSKVPVRFGELLEKRLGLPTIIESHAVPLAAYERLFGRAQDVENCIVVTVGYGIGMGLIINGAVYRGAHGFASEFGHTKAVENGPQCECGQFGCLESFAGQKAIILAASRLAASPIGSASPSDDPIVREAQVEELADMARAGNEDVRRIFENAGHQIGRSLANIVCVLDPAKVILTGATINSADLWLDSLRASLSSGIRPAVAERLEIVSQSISDDSWARGAAALVLQNLYGTERSRSQPEQSR